MAAERFNADRGTTFQAFAIQQMRWECHKQRDKYRQRVYIKPSMVYKMSGFKRARNEIRKQLGREVLFEEVCDHLRLSYSQRKNLWSAFHIEEVTNKLPQQREVENG